MKIHFLVNRRVPDVPSPVLAEVYRHLARAGHQVLVSIPEEELRRCDQVDVDADLYVIKSHTELAYSLAGALDTAGARQLNPYAAWSLTQDKIIIANLLRAGGIPTPNSWITSSPDLLDELIELHPLIVKPHRGHRGEGIRVVTTRQDLENLDLTREPVIVQERIPGPGHDLKVYIVGQHVFGVVKPFSEVSFARAGVPCNLDSSVADIARRCGTVLGLGLYGIDVIESPSGPVVVDVNTFPGYKGVPDPGPMIAQYIDDFACGRFELQPSLPVTGSAVP